MNELLILGYKTYSFTNENTGELIEGAKVYVLPQDQEKNQNQSGLLPMSLACPLDLLTSLTDLPGKYEISYSCRVGKNQKMETVPSSFKLVKKVQL